VPRTGRGSGTRGRWPHLAALGAILALTGCDLLLGSAPEADLISNITWMNEVIASGDIDGIDAALGPSGDVVVSWIHDRNRLRTSQQSGSGWKEYEGPAVAVGPLDAVTHLAVDGDGTIGVLFWTGSDMQISTFATGGERHFSLLTLEAVVYGGGRPTAWDPSSAGLTFTGGGCLRAVVQEASSGRLWLFQEESDGSWNLRPVAASEGVINQIDLVTTPGDDLDVVFQAAGAGVYYRWSESTGWTQRLDIPYDPPYLIRMKADGTSVLATRHLNRIVLAEERLSSESGTPRWFLFEVIEHEDLYWKTLDMILDSQEWPGVIHLLGPYRDRYFELWYSYLVGDGTWGRAQVAANLDLENAFNPFQVRMVRDPEDRIHILLISGGIEESAGGGNDLQPRLLHLTSEGSLLP